MYKNVIFKIVSVYCGLLIICGTLGNAFVFYVASRNRTNTTFLFLMFLSVSDTITLYWWNLNHFVRPFWGIDLQNSNYIYCKFMNFFQFSSFQISGWMLVLIAFDRYLSVLLVTWKTVYFKPRRALIVAIFTVLSIIAINFHVLFTFGHVRINNGTRSDECFSSPDVRSTKIMADWQIVHSSLYSYLPFTLLVIFNTLLITLLQIRRKKVTQISSSSSTTVNTLSQNHTNKQKSLNITVISLTTLYIVMTLFGTLASIYYDTLLESETGLIILYVFDAIATSYHALNFILLLITNRKFREEALGFFKKNRKILNNSSTN